MKRLLRLLPLATLLFASFAYAQPVSDDSEFDAASSPTAVQKKISPSEIKAGLADVQANVQKCGQNGTLTVMFDLSNSKAKNVKAVDGSIAGSAAEKCILDAIKKRDWPYGKATHIKYTFKLDSPPDAKAAAKELDRKRQVELQRKRQEALDEEQRAEDEKKIQAELNRLRAQAANIDAAPRDADKEDHKSRKAQAANNDAIIFSNTTKRPAAEDIKNAVANAQRKAAKCGKGGNLTVSLDLAGGSAKNVKAVGGSFAGSATEKCILTVIQKNEWPDGSAKNIKFSVKL